MGWLPLKLTPEAGQAGEGDPWGRSTGANALFCLVEGKEEKGRRDEEELEPPVMVGLDGMTADDKEDF